MKATLKTRHLLAILLVAIFGLAIVNTIGVFTVFVLSDPYTVLEIVLGFFNTFVLFCGGVAFIDYEGQGTPLNMMLNGLFLFFLIAAIASSILLLRKALRGSNK